MTNTTCRTPPIVAADGRRVAGRLVGRLPQRLAVGRRKRHQPRAVAPAHVEQQLVALDDRAAARAKVALGRFEVLTDIAQPNLLAGVERQAGQLAAGPQQINVLVVDQRHAARSVVGGDRACIRRGKSCLPSRVARWRRRALRPPVGCLRDETESTDLSARPRRQSRGRRALPDDRRPAGRPGAGKLLARRAAIALGTQDLRPIARRGAATAGPADAQDLRIAHVRSSGHAESLRSSSVVAGCMAYGRRHTVDGRYVRFGIRAAQKCRDCHDLAVPCEQNGTVRLAEAILSDAFRTFLADGSRRGWQCRRLPGKPSGGHYNGLALACASARSRPRSAAAWRTDDIRSAEIQGVSSLVAIHQTLREETRRPPHRLQGLRQSWARRCSSASSSCIGCGAFAYMFGTLVWPEWRANRQFARSHLRGARQADRRKCRARTSRPRIARNSTFATRSNDRAVRRGRRLRRHAAPDGRSSGRAGDPRPVRSRPGISLLVRPDRSASRGAGARLQRLAVPARC